MQLLGAADVGVRVEGVVAGETFCGSVGAVAGVKGAVAGVVGAVAGVAGVGVGVGDGVAGLVFAVRVTDESNK